MDEKVAKTPSGVQPATTMAKPATIRGRTRRARLPFSQDITLS